MDIRCSDFCCHCGGHCVKKVPIFSSLSEAHKDKIIEYINHKNIRKGQLVFRDGDTCSSLYVINRGSLKVFTLNKEGKEQILYILKEGDFLGDINLFKEEKFQFSASALEDTNLCILSKANFYKILEENPEINIKILEYTYDKIINLEKLVKALTSKDIDARISFLLINLANTFGKSKNGQIEIDFYMGREDMANFLGVTRETVSRRLSLLQNENIIEIAENKKIVIKDMETLKDMK